jgi:hypothetical protein
VRAAADELQERTVAMPVLRRRRRLSTLLATAAAAALGFLAFRLVWQNPNRGLLADLPVIDNVDVYTQFEDAAFLRSLGRELGAEFKQLGAVSPDVAVRLARLDAVAPEAERNDWLRQLGDDDRTNLLAKFNRFSELPAAEQESLRRLHGEIAAAQDAPELRRTMLLYQEWLGGLSPAEQFELRSMPPAARVGAIKQRMAEMREDTLLALSKEELQTLTRKLRDPLEKMMRAKMQELIRKGEIRRPPPNSGRGGGNFVQFQLRRSIIRDLVDERALPGDIQAAIVAGLPERARPAFEALEPREKIEQFGAWMRQADSFAGEVPQQELERFFAEDLDAQTREALLSLPPGEMQQALRQRYRRQPHAGFGGPGSWGAPDQWRDGPGDRRRDGPASGRERPRGEFDQPRGPDGPRGFDDRRPADRPPGDGPPPRRRPPPERRPDDR